MASIICVHFSELVDHCGNIHPPHDIIEQLDVKILVSPLERQVS